MSKSPDNQIPESVPESSGSGLSQELAAEKRKCQQIWEELVRVGKSWEAQADYIKGLEAERKRLNDALGELYDSYRGLLLDVINPDSPAETSDAILKRFSLNAKPSSLDVILCYLIFYCRLPDSQTKIDNLLAKVRNRGDLLRAFLFTAETRELYPSLIPFEFTGRERGMHIEEVESQETLTRFFDNTKRVWSSFGESEPHWSVMTDERYRSATIAEQIDQFFASGRTESDRFLKTLERNGIDWSRITSFLDFGCGVGRITLNLSDTFPSLFGVDISRGHLNAARKICQERGVGNIEWIQLESLKDLENLPQVDAFFSVIVLQHNPPPVSQFILRNLLEKLNPGGVGFFQVPSYIEGYQFDIEFFLAHSQNTIDMEMHPIPQANIFRMCKDAKVDVLEVFEDRWCKDMKAISNTFVVRKNSLPQ